MCQIIHVFRYECCGHTIRRFVGEDAYCLLRSNMAETKKAEPKRGANTRPIEPGDKTDPRPVEPGSEMNKNTEVFCTSTGGVRKLKFHCTGQRHGDVDFTNSTSGTCVRCQGEAKHRAARPDASDRDVYRAGKAAGAVYGLDADERRCESELLTAAARVKRTTPGRAWYITRAADARLRGFLLSRPSRDVLADDRDILPRLVAEVASLPECLHRGFLMTKLGRYSAVRYRSQIRRAQALAEALGFGQDFMEGHNVVE